MTELYRAESTGRGVYHIYKLDDNAYIHSEIIRVADRVKSARHQAVADEMGCDIKEIFFM